MLKPNPFSGRPTCYFLIGIPASGKSTWRAEHLLTACDPTHVASTDDVLETLAIEHGITYSEAHRTMFKVADKAYKAGLLEAIGAGHDLIIDRTNMSVAARNKVKTYLNGNKAADYRTTGVVFETPLEIVRERLHSRFESTGKYVPWEVIERMISEYQAPSVHEFDRLVYVRP